MKVRHPAVAGSWYPGTPKGLKAQIEECFTHGLGPGKIPKVTEDGPRQIVGLVCPHAGYVYSGPVAAHSYYNLALDGKPEIIILLGPNHRGYGSALAIMNEGVWRTPLGDVEIDTETANQIVRESRIIDIDESAHGPEHSLEMQFPFLQYLYGQTFRFVPICFLMQDLETGREVGQALAKALSGKNAVVIASTDMTHYEPQKTAELKDKKALNAVLKLDEGQLYSVVESYGISMCGYGPTIAMITAAKAMGAKEAQLLCYKTSGDVTGDYSAVVGYASVSLSK